MIRFESDYLEGAHPRILARMMETNLDQTPGYGTDEICAHARELIRQRIARPDADMHVLVGGTQTNFTFLSAALRPHQGALSADTGHIAVHETGAIEAGGHKVIALPAVDGKLAAGQVSEYCRNHFSDTSREHTVMPKVVYISYPTELGTLYTRSELNALRGVCDEWNLYLYIDGARMGYGLASDECDIDLPFIASVSDAFYIGGTKQGALFGEALVLLNPALKEDFRYILKQNGGMLAKGRLLGIQFEELFRDDLYMELSRHADALAAELRALFRAKNIPVLVESPTNQLFPILPNAFLKSLSQNFTFSVQFPIDPTHTCIRLCTSWSTPRLSLDALAAALDHTDFESGSDSKST